MVEYLMKNFRRKFQNLCILVLFKVGGHFVSLSCTHLEVKKELLVQLFIVWVSLVLTASFWISLNGFLGPVANSCHPAPATGIRNRSRDVDKRRRKSKPDPEKISES